VAAQSLEAPSPALPADILVVAVAVAAGIRPAGEVLEEGLAAVAQVGFAGTLAGDPVEGLVVEPVCGGKGVVVVDAGRGHPFPYSCRLVGEGPEVEL